MKIARLKLFVNKSMQNFIKDLPKILKILTKHKIENLLLFNK